jgi:cyanophycinase
MKNKNKSTNEDIDREKRKVESKRLPRFLIPIGGNEKKSPDSEIFREMVDLAGGSKARIVVVPTASETPGERARDYKTLFSTFKPESIQTVHIGERPDAGSAELCRISGTLQDHQ